MSNFEARKIKAVNDLSWPPGRQYREVGAILDDKTEAMMLQFRWDAEAARAGGHQRFTCASCGGDVVVRNNPSTKQNPLRDGTKIHFAHKGPSPRRCEWRSSSEGNFSRREKFDGAPESDEHLSIKEQLADLMAIDGRFTGIEKEQQFAIGSRQRGHRKPDLRALFTGEPIALEVQLASISLTDIVGREKDYAERGIRLIWLTGPDSDRLLQLSFADIYNIAGGRIFVVDEASIRASSRAGRFMLTELSLTPRIAQDRPVHSIWTKQAVGMDTIMLGTEARRKAGEMAYEQKMAALAQQWFAVPCADIHSDATIARTFRRHFKSWNAIATVINGPDFHRADDDGLGAVLSFLGAVTASRSNRRQTTRPSDQDVMRSFDRLVTLPGWAALVELVTEMYPEIFAELSSDRRNLLRAALVQKAPRRVGRYAGMLSVLFPDLAYKLTSRVPRVSPNRNWVT